MFLAYVVAGCTPQPPGEMALQDPRPTAPTDDDVALTAVASRSLVLPRVSQDTGSGADTATADTGTEEVVVPLVARLTVDVAAGEYPLEVTLDATDSDLGSGLVRYEWDLGDGTEVSGDATRVHTYIGKGNFDAEVTLYDDGTGEVSVAAITIDVDEPSCPSEASPRAWGVLESSLDAVSGIAASRRDPDLYWLEQDNDDDLAVVDSTGQTISEHDLPSEDDLEDIEVAVDPQTGISWLFVGNFGDNYLAREHVEVWVAEEPDPYTDSDIDPVRMELQYPDGPHDVETLLVDPLTFDLLLVTKELEEQKVYRKRPPHDSGGPFVLEDLGAFDELDLRATGGAVSPDGLRIVVRDYTTTVRMWYRDGYQPLHEAFEDGPCRIDIVDDDHGEGVTFTSDGRGIVTINEGVDVPLYYVEL